MSALSRQPSIGLGRFIASVLLPVAIGLGLFYLTMNPPMSDFSAMMELMLLTTLLSLVLAFAAYRLGWFNRLPRLQWSLLAVYLLAGVLVFLNVWIIARMMFASSHDLMLATILLVFATGIAAAVGIFLSAALTDRILTLNRAAERIARGELDTRVIVEGRDELAQLTRSFNAMAAQLELAQQKQQELDMLRRELVAWVSHDLRTPLTSMRAVLEALADGVVDDPATVQRYYRVAQQDIRSLSHLIDDLFDVSQIDAGGLQLDVDPNSIGDLISDTIESFSETARQQSVQLEGEVQPGTDPVRDGCAAHWPRVGESHRRMRCATLRRADTFTWRRGARPKALKWKWSIPAKAFVPKICPTSSIASIAARNRAVAPRAERGWGWPSRAASSKRTADRSAWKAKWGTARGLCLCCRRNE